MNTSPKSISVVIPCFNNEASVQQLHRRLTSVLTSLGNDFEIIFVNDGSRDRTGQILRDLVDTNPSTLLISFSRNFGQHPAISAGLAAANGDYVVLMDADLQDRPENIPQLVKSIESDQTVEIVYTSVLKESDSRPRLSSRLFHWMFARLIKRDMPKNVGTFRLFSRRVRDALLEYQEQAVVYGPLMSQIGFLHQTVSVRRDEPVGRRTSYGFRRRLQLALSSSLYYGNSLPRAVISLGGLLAATSAAYLGVVLITYIFGQRSFPPGTVLLLSVLLLTSGVILLAVGVLTAYAVQTFREVLRRPRYHISSIHGIGLTRENT
jgi:glycosyltransferase involved in cell wall biosynthesis